MDPLAAAGRRALAPTKNGRPGAGFHGANVTNIGTLLAAEAEADVRERIAAWLKSTTLPLRRVSAAARDLGMRTADVERIVREQLAGTVLTVTSTDGTCDVPLSDLVELRCEGRTLSLVARDSP
jgi:hypothetical protein